jgi:outer membrane immunogenic protein
MFPATGRTRLDSGDVMKKSLLLGAALVVLAGAAQAADLPRKMPVKAPPAPVWSWTGFYIGGYYGTSLSQSKATTDGTAGSVDLNDTGITAGGTLGYNWQFSPIGLVGIEGDVGWLGTKRTFTDFDSAQTFGAKSTWYATLRGRLGYVTGPSVLYVTGGGAWVNAEESFGVPAAVTTNKDTETGWTAGVGIETKLSRSWTAKTEYLYMDLGSASVTGVIPGAATQTASYDNQFHVLKTGLNYKFGEPFELPLFLSPLGSPQRWAGLYAGANLGGAISNVRVPSSTFVSGTGETDINGTGFVGGGHAGYNFVVFSNWIAGFEGDIGYMGVSRDYTDWNNTGAPGTLYQPGTETDWYATARARVGTSTGPAFLYATGGLAVVSVENSVVVDATRYSIDGTRVGWTFGGGLETELSPQWSARLESLYMDVGKETLSAPGGSVEFKNRFTVVRAGLSYKFGGPEIVTSRY